MAERWVLTGFVINGQLNESVVFRKMGNWGGGR